LQPAELDYRVINLATTLRLPPTNRVSSDASVQRQPGTAIWHQAAARGIDEAPRSVSIGSPDPACSDRRIAPGSTERFSFTRRDVLHQGAGMPVSVADAVDRRRQ
jgi:hypothetical protein